MPYIRGEIWVASAGCKQSTTSTSPDKVLNSAPDDRYFILYVIRLEPINIVSGYNNPYYHASVFNNFIAL